jgi:predicted GNAT family N-acyltransferase
MDGLGASVQLVTWDAYGPTLRAIRRVVFVEEQHVPEQLEDDGLDASCVHALATDAHGRAIGTGRMLADGRIGRLAVLASCRGGGVGAAMLLALIAAARDAGLTEVYLHAQTRAQAFYARYGFVRDGAEYLEAGITHVNMRASLSAVRTAPRS